MSLGLSWWLTGFVLVYGIIYMTLTNKQTTKLTFMPYTAVFFGLLFFVFIKKKKNIFKVKLFTGLWTAGTNPLQPPKHLTTEQSCKKNNETKKQTRQKTATKQNSHPKKQCHKPTVIFFSLLPGSSKWQQRASATCELRKQEQTTILPQKRERIDFSLILLKWSLVTETESPLCRSPPPLPPQWLAGLWWVSEQSWLLSYLFPEV